MDTDYICSKNNNSGMHFCSNLPAFKNGTNTCTLTAEQKNLPEYSNNDTYCIDWHIYYTMCSDKNENPFQDTISFDNIGLAWIAIFLVSLLFTLKRYVPSLKMYYILLNDRKPCFSISTLITFFANVNKSDIPANQCF